MVCKLHNWVWATGTKRAISDRIRPEHQPLLSFWLQQRWPDIRQGSLQNGSWKDVRDTQLALRAAIEELRQCEEVSHLDKFARRLQREPSGDPGCNEDADSGTQEGVANAGSTVRVLQGARNNLTGAPGFRAGSCQGRSWLWPCLFGCCARTCAVHTYPCLCRDAGHTEKSALFVNSHASEMCAAGYAAEFYALLIAPCAIGLSRPMHAATTEQIHQDTSSSVEVDVVAAQGCAWIEVKAITGALTMRDWLQPNRSCCTSLKAQVRRAVLLRACRRAFKCKSTSVTSVSCSASRLAKGSDLQISRYCMAASSTSASVAWAQPAVVLFLPLLEALAPDVEQDMLTMGCTPLLLGRPPVLRGADLHSAKTEADSLAAAALGQAHDDTDRCAVCCAWVAIACASRLQTQCSSRLANDEETAWRVEKIARR